MNPIPYGRQNIDQNDIKAVISTLQSDFLTQGPKVKEFETKFAEYVGSNYAVAVNNATSGLHLSVLALNLVKGDRVITTPITFAASANCIRYAGAEVWFADIDPNTYLLDINSVRELIESKPKGFFKGIIPVDFAGLPINTEEFKDLADAHNLWIIEDACHAPGGYFMDSKGQKNFCGNGNYTDIAVFSFHPVKHIACGEGGMVTTNSKELYDKLMLLRTHGITKENMDENHGGWYYEMKALGFNYRLTDFQSALGMTQLSKNEKGVKTRNKIASVYKKAFEGLIKFQDLPDNLYNAHHLFIIEVENRKKLYDYLRSNNIFSQIHYIPIHLLPYYKNIGYEGANLMNSENYYANCISLPMYPTLTLEEQNFVISKVLKFISNGA
ncbi:MAG: UDP-4-amino-4,6-dideoxy-N-acetyl-beta-L-altrosamine transaminase [Flavobacteriaceae bacterium]|nr:UDP-4-amino-4,6-dideoxy-N-acetyl-beta-L-altrosamine transaminase [Flavobacteriaceae bacterium]